MRWVSAKERRRWRRRQRSREYQLWKASLVRAFVQKRGWAALQQGTVVAPGVDIFSWVHTKRMDYRNGRIAHWQVEICEAIEGWSWDPVRDRYVRDIDNLRRFALKHGWDAVTQETELDGVNIVRWCINRRAAYRRGKLAPWLVKALEAIPGWCWEPTSDRRLQMLAAVRAYIECHGRADFGQQTWGVGGLPIGRWAHYMREEYRNGKLPKWLQRELESLPGWAWEPAKEKQLRMIPVLRKFVANHGWDALCANTVVEGEKLGDWCHHRRRPYQEGTLPAWMKEDLEAIPGWKKWAKTPLSTSRRVPRRTW